MHWIYACFHLTIVYVFHWFEYCVINNCFICCVYFMIYQNGHLDDKKWNEMLEEEYHMFQGLCVCKVLVFKPLCFIISWWFCFSVIKYSSDLDTHTHTHTHTHTRSYFHTHIHTLNHMKKSHSAIYWSHSLYSLCHGAETASSIMCPRINNR